jgi:hypothetical protein
MGGVTIVSSIISAISRFSQNYFMIIWASLVTILTSIAIIPIGYGIYIWAKKVLSGEKTETKDIFSVYTDSSLLKRIVVQVLIFIGLYLAFMLCLGLLFMFICIIMMIIGFAVFRGNIPFNEGMLYNGFNPNLIFDSRLAIIIGVFVLVALAIMIVAIYFGIRLSASQYMLISYPNMKVTETISRSFKLMKGHVWDYIVLALSIMWPVFVVAFGTSIFVGFFGFLSRYNLVLFTMMSQFSSIITMAVSFIIMPYYYLALVAYFNKLDADYINSLNANTTNEAKPEVETADGIRE